MNPGVNGGASTAHIEPQLKTPLRKLEGHVLVDDHLPKPFTSPAAMGKRRKRQVEDDIGGCSPNPTCRRFRNMGRLILIPETTTSPGSNVSDQAAFSRDTTERRSRKDGLTKIPAVKKY